MHAGKNIVASEISSNADETYRYKCIGGNGLRGYVQQFNTEGSFPIIGRQGALCGNINGSSEILCDDLIVEREKS